MACSIYTNRKSYIIITSIIEKTTLCTYVWYYQKCRSCRKQENFCGI